MSNRYALGALAIMVAVSATGFVAHAQDASKYPDYCGQRRGAEVGPPRYDSTKPPGRGQQAPLTEEFRVVHEASMADQAAGGQGGDLTYRCLPMGMPRAMTTIFPLEVIVMPKITYVLFENSNAMPRRIYTDGRGWPEDDEPTFVGYSVGRWSDTDG